MIQNSPPQDVPFSDKIWKNFSRRVDSKRITVILGLEELKHFYPFSLQWNFFSNFAVFLHDRWSYFFSSLSAIHLWEYVSGVSCNHVILKIISLVSLVPSWHIYIRFNIVPVTHMPYIQHPPSCWMTSIIFCNFATNRYHLLSSQIVWVGHTNCSLKLSYAEIILWSHQFSWVNIWSVPWYQVPQQKNEYDCGLFVLYFMEKFIEDAPERFRRKYLHSMVRDTSPSVL